EINSEVEQLSGGWDDNIGTPVIMKLNPDMLPVMMVAVGMDNMEYAQVSTYVNDTLMPEVESLEGVASASAIGLLEESVHVIIRQEKVDALNRQIYAAIDEKMREAEEELEDGRQTIADSRQELEDGKKEITDGIRELNDGRTELQEGKEELSKTQEETAAKLAETKNQLLTAKTSLDAAKTTLTTNLTTAKALQAGIEEMDKVIENTTHYISEYGKLIGGLSVSGSDADIDDQTREQIHQLKSEFLGSDIVKQMAANEQAASMINRLAELDWAEPENFQTVYANLGLITAGVSTQIMSQRSNMEQSLNALTNGLGVAAYEETVNQTMATIEENLAKVNSGLIEVEKGELTAAVEFANAASQINLGEYQMELAQAQLDAAQEQIKTGEEQLTEAEKQLQEGQEQLEDARQEAYDSADMTEILTVDMIKSLLTAQNFSMPAGYVTEEGIDYLVRVGDKPTTLEELEALPLMDLHMDGVPVITLGDVADVFYTDNSAEIYTNVNGSPGCMLSIQKQTGYSTGEVSDLLKEKFADMMETDEDLTVITLMDQGIYIDLVMDSILSNILWGGLLAILILLLFLKDLRPTLVVACSIPVSLVTAIVCMYFSGVTLNIISLSGLALGIGMLVDNSIVVIENIYRMRSEGLSVREAAIEGTKEVSGAIFASTLTTVCVFAPIVFTEGITRQLFVDMGLTIAYSLLASLIIALTVVPALASKMLTKTKEQKEGRFFTALTKGYVKVLGGALKVKSLVLVLSLAMLVISFALAWTNGTAFMSDMDSTQMTVSVQLAKDATLEETAEVTDTVVERIMEIEDVTDVGAMASTSSLALLTGGGNSSTNSTEIYVVASEDKKLSNEEIAQIILEKTADLEAEITVDTSSMDMSSMGGSGISIQVRGRDLDTLQQVAGEVAAVVESVEGTTQVSDGMEESSEELRITIDKEKAVQYGLTVAQVYTQIMPR
ncbi:MAG: efflux RND transporter permease subunit, partial [Lachnospiraceae bacterium]|nr:efflux RND transporter permease subunit [Lachnospiraceae bacterium]